MSIPSLSTPIPGAMVTSIWGDAREYRDGIHAGIDLRAPVGTPVRAAGSGKVIHVDTTDDSFGGLWVAIEHASGWITRYLHLSSQKVVKGQQVAKGQVIGLSGTTGTTSAAPHLHFDMGVRALSEYPLKSPTPVKVAYAGVGDMYHVPAEPFVGGLVLSTALAERAKKIGLPLGTLVVGGSIALVLIAGVALWLWLRR